MYALLRAIAGVALRWFYRDIQVEGADRIPRKRPLLLVVNHPNALVDALLVSWVVPRRIIITAKSTIFANPLAALLLHRIGVVPLQRAQDPTPASRRGELQPNQRAFRAVGAALRRGRAVLIFPEGRSHDAPSLGPLKSGAARMAIEAYDSGEAPDLAIVPIGLTFERKDAPRTRVLVQIGEPILLADWRPAAKAAASDELTREIETRLRAITLNYDSADDAARAVRLASLVAGLFQDVPAIGVERGLGTEAAIARRIEYMSRRLRGADASLRAQADRLVRRMDTVETVAAKHGVLIEDVRISLAGARGLRFVLREGWLFLVAGPIALWGRINHWLPFRAARVLALRSVESAVDPAMRTVVGGAAFVLLAYLVQTTIVGLLWGPLAGGCYLVSLPIAADINFCLSDRLQRASQRARAFLRFRRDPGLQCWLADELALLRRDVAALDVALREQSGGVAASA
jgi:1-acyl-sn-glycerol-3-phosphate acyltransferase